MLSSLLPRNSFSTLNDSNLIKALAYRSHSFSLNKHPLYALPRLHPSSLSIPNTSWTSRLLLSKRQLHQRPFLFALDTTKKSRMFARQLGPLHFTFTEIPSRPISFFASINPFRRIPLLIAGSLASGFAYIQFKLSASSQWLSDQIQTGKTKLTEMIDSFSHTLQPLQSHFENRLQFFQNISPFHSKDISNSTIHTEAPTISVHETSSLTFNSPPEQETSATSGSSNKNEALLDLTRHLIQIRSLLNSVQVSGDLLLPSIVVIGSQSSGKSSLLETLVGQTFLPKGKNMVTRRPLELTLIHAPEVEVPYVDLPQLGLKKLTDFQHLQKILMDLNLAVKDQCISDEPIQVIIHGAHLPNLSLVDLPGYIQVHAQHQPASLKESIVQLCDKYIQSPNIILAVCAADVDLANAEALRAARKADPLGERTIGVLTKMDLVDTQTKQQLLQITKKDYPLSLGYVGMSQPHPSASMSPLFTPFGLAYLKQLLVKTLEVHMSQRLSTVMDAVHKALAEINYQYKVMYNDRALTPETYIAETIDLFKQNFKSLEKKYGRLEVNESVREFLNQKIIELCIPYYWQPSSSSFSEYTAAQLDLACSALTKSGIGLATTHLVIDKIESNLHDFLQQDPFVHHPSLQLTLKQLYHRLLEKQFRVTVDQVENVLKPFKFEIQCSLNEWQASIVPALHLIDNEIHATKQSMIQLQRQLGRRQLRKLMAQIKHDQTEGVPKEMLDQAQHVLQANHYVTILKARKKKLQSRQCRQPNPECPEIMLSAIANQLAQTASMFIYIELLHEFYFQFPRELDTLFLYNYTKEQIHALANEHPIVQQQLTLFHKKTVLETVANHLSLLMKEKLK